MTDMQYRPAVPAEDFEYAYGLVVRTIRDIVISMAGEYPEPFQRDFYWEKFQHPEASIILHDGQPAGFFCIRETGDSVRIDGLYIEPALQGQGLGRAVLDLALEKAHAARKPLVLEVLQANTQAKAMYEHCGFKTFGQTSWDWVREFEMRHKDTNQYVRKAAPKLDTPLP